MKYTGTHELKHAAIKTYRCLFILLFLTAAYLPLLSQQVPPTYKVKKLSAHLTIDANWNKKVWKKTKAAVITNFIRQVPAFHPDPEVKMRYDAQNIYVIFRVHDRYVRSVTTDINGPVWKDAAVEFFFCPDTSRPNQYFNLEINCGGTPLLGFSSSKPTPEDIKTIEIAHSLPKTNDPEITDAVMWTLEYRLPLSTLRKYSSITQPAKGVKWKANFCKIAENNSNPHYMTWSPITALQPNFHMPQFFGSILFQ
ncbi:MAG TPA: carbohydrate-binding family 9-like protein [Flavitalea sp.]|nr:carbohydrate-binding family 9-like protein [Flavitalea sp.]